MRYNKIKGYIPYISIIIFSIIMISTPIFAEISVIKLSYANPDSVARTLKNLYGRKFEVSAASMINAIVIRTYSKKQLNEIKNILKSLDRKCATLCFTIKELSDIKSQDKSLNISTVNSHSNSSILDRHNKLQGTHSVTAMEFQKAQLTNSISHIIPTGWQGLTMHKATRGLKISGYLINSNTVIIKIWYSSGNYSDATTLMTSVVAKLGTWIHIGNNTNKSKPKPTIGVEVSNSKLSISSRLKQKTSSQQFLIKVDLIQ